MKTSRFSRFRGSILPLKPAEVSREEFLQIVDSYDDKQRETFHEKFIRCDADGSGQPLRRQLRLSRTCCHQRAIHLALRSPWVPNQESFE